MKTEERESWLKFTQESNREHEEEIEEFKRRFGESKFCQEIDNEVEKLDTVEAIEYVKKKMSDVQISDPDVVKMEYLGLTMKKLIGKGLEEIYREERDEVREMLEEKLIKSVGDMKFTLA